MKPDELERLFLPTALKRPQLLEEDVQAATKEYDEILPLKDHFRSLPDRGEAILKRVARHSNVDGRILAIAILGVDESYALDALKQNRQFRLRPRIN